MPIQTTVVGSYPKPPEEGRPFAVRKALHSLERGEVTTDDVRAAQDDLVREVLAQQETAGIDVVTDGQARWDDILTPFAGHMAGFEIGGLLRWFDNNTYYRRPVCTGPVEWRGPASVDAFRFAADAATRPVKAVVPGPLTFARLSVDEHYRDHRAFVMALAQVLAQEAFELEAAGARYIQIDEPGLLDAPEDLDLAAEALGAITSELSSATTILATYFDDAKRLGRGLFELPCDRVGLDLVSGAESVTLLDELPEGKQLQAGIVDARNTKLEPLDELTASIEQLTELVGLERLSLAPSAGLEYLPREKARAKLVRLAEAAGKAGG